eukprot:3559062-Pleurochrysis_carterae.AAC.6
MGTARAWRGRTRAWRGPIRARVRACSARVREAHPHTLGFAIVHIVRACTGERARQRMRTCASVS